MVISRMCVDRGREGEGVKGLDEAVHKASSKEQNGTSHREITCSGWWLTVLSVGWLEVRREYLVLRCSAYKKFCGYLQ